jgi:hypothetical protein
VFNVFGKPVARLKELTESLARDKAGLESLGPRARVEVCEVTEVIESADRGRALRLDGPVACMAEGSALVDVETNRERLCEAAGRAACSWLAAIQGEDGSLPLFVRPATGKGEGRDLARSAMTAEGLAAFGVAYGLDSAVDCAKRVLAWLGRLRSEGTPSRAAALPTAIYVGRAKAYLGEQAAVEAAARDVLDLLDGADPGPLVLAHAASFLDRASAHHAPAARRVQALRDGLASAFARACSSETPVNLAEWAELVAAFPADSRVANEVGDWLRTKQLASGAFPETTASDFVYSRGTGKVFEVLSLRAGDSEPATGRALQWLLSMQYRPDSAFFVPHEHWSRVLGGLRHDYYGPDAWIDAAGHFLLGLARLRKR